MTHPEHDEEREADRIIETLVNYGVCTNRDRRGKNACTDCNLRIKKAKEAILAHTAKAVEEAEDRARFEMAYRLLLGAEGRIFVPKAMLEIPLTDYEITTYTSPDPDMPGVMYKLDHATLKERQDT